MPHFQIERTARPGAQLDQCAQLRGIRACLVAGMSHVPFFVNHDTVDLAQLLQCAAAETGAPRVLERVGVGNRQMRPSPCRTNPPACLETSGAGSRAGDRRKIVGPAREQRERTHEHCFGGPHGQPSRASWPSVCFSESSPQPNMRVVIRDAFTLSREGVPPFRIAMSRVSSPAILHSQDFSCISSVGATGRDRSSTPGVREHSRQPS